MKNFWATILLTILVIISIAASSCIKIVVEPTSGGKEVISTEKQAIDTLVEFSMVNQLAVLSMLEIFSEDFTQPFFGENVVISDEDYEEMIALMEELSAYEEPVMASLHILVPEELASQHQLYACLVQPDSYLVPACGSPGMLDSFLGFFGYAGDAGKRSSNRILECTKGLEEVEKEDLFGSLSSSERKGATNYNEWEQKLKNGELDDKATRIHQKFMLDPAYIGQATEKNQRPIDVAYKEGGQMVVKGGKFLSDAATTVVDTALPGFSKGVEIAQNINDKVEKTKKFVKKAYAGDMKGAVVEALKDKIDDTVTGKMGEVLGEEISDVVTHLTQQATGKGKPSELVEAGLNYGQAKIKDSDKKSKPQIAVALNKDDNAPIQMVTHVSDQDEPTLNLPEGGYLVVTADQDGNCDADKDVAVVAGQETVVAVNTQGTGSAATSQATNAQPNMIEKIQETITAELGKSQDTKPGAEPTDKKSPLETLKEIQSAATAGLGGDNNGDGTGNGAGDGGGSGNAVPAPTPTPAQITGCDWNGRWKTNHAGLTLIQTGGQVTGTYGLMGETMEGTVSGNTFKGTWRNPSNSASTGWGEIELTMADDCNSFTGHWRYNSIEWDLEWDGIWTGTRISTAP